MNDFFSDFKKEKESEDLTYHIVESFGIDNVSLGGLDISIVKEIIEGLQIVYSKYPLIFERIDAIGTEEYIKNEVLNTYGPKSLEALEQLNTGNNIMSCFAIEKKQFFPIARIYDYKYISILITDKILDVKKNGSSNNDVIDNLGTVKSIIIHELGHVLDHLLGLSTDKILKHRLVNLNSSIANEYKIGRIEEVIAILFQVYMNGDNNELANTMISRLNEKYAELELKKSKMHR